MRSDDTSQPWKNWRSADASLPSFGSCQGSFIIRHAMTKHTTTTRPLFCTAIAVFIFARVVTAAQPPPATPPSRPADEPVTLEAFTVTGSNIKGVDTEQTLPITLITADDITMSGVST